MLPRYVSKFQACATRAPSPCLAINPANNQITGTCSTPGGFSYDANGNMTNDGVNTLAYDAENHTVTANSSNTYAYDGKGLRVQKVASGATTSYIFSGSKVIAEYDGSGSLKTEYIYAGDQLLASTWGLSNPGFEEGLIGWQTYGTATLETNSSIAHSGNDCVQLSTAAYASVMFSEYFPVTSGQQVNFGGWAYRVSGSTGYARWKLVELDSNYNPVAYPDPSPNNESAGSWTYQSGSVTIPSGVAYVRLYAEIWNVSDSVTANFDDGFISAGGTNYYLRDHLSARVITDANANVIGEQGHLPFGEAWYSSNATTKWQFTSYELDSETANDYAQARYHINRLGRFASPDPLGGDSADPQTLNRYSYTRDEPIDFNDPSGADMHELCWTQNDGPPDDPDWERYCIYIGDNNNQHTGGQAAGGSSGGDAGGSSGGGQAPAPSPKPKPQCPSKFTQTVFAAMITSNPASSAAMLEALGLAKLTGNTAVVGVSGSAGGSVWPAAMLGGSVGASVGIAADPQGNIGLAVSGQLGGGYNRNPTTGVAYAGGGSITFTRQPTIFTLTGSSPFVSVSGGSGLGGSLSRTLSGSTTITIGVANGISTSGGGKFTRVFILICS